MDSANAGTVMMDVYFNELSVPFPILKLEDTEDIVHSYAETIKEACRQGFDKVRYEKGVEFIMLREDYSLAQYLNENSNSQSVQVLLATQTRPYIPEGDEKEESYVMNSYRVKWKDDEVEAEGIVIAALAGSMGIGMVNDKWNHESYTVIEKSSENPQLSHEIIVPYAYDTAFFSSEIFLRWADDKLEPEIEACGMLPIEKTINLPEHHGKDILKAYAKRLVRETYVKGIINSIDRNSKERKFISGLHDNIIYITLINDGHFGLAVSTTARNERELRYIAKLIEKKYR